MHFTLIKLTCVVSSLLAIILHNIIIPISFFCENNLLGKKILRDKFSVYLYNVLHPIHLKNLNGCHFNVNWHNLHWHVAKMLGKCIQTEFF